MEKIQANAPARATAVDGQETIGEAPYRGIVTSVSYVPEAAITGANTNTRRLTVVNRGQSGSGLAEIAGLSFTAGVNGVENDEKALTLSATRDDRKVAAGDVLELVSTHLGTGLADPGGLVQVEISRT